MFAVIETKGFQFVVTKGEKIKIPANLIRMVAATKPYAKVDLIIIRDKQRQTLNVEIGKRPK